jgi:hypothetical protein
MQYPLAHKADHYAVHVLSLSTGLSQDFLSVPQPLSIDAAYPVGPVISSRQ